MACLQTAVQFGDTTVCERLTELAALVGGPRAPLAARYAGALRDDDAYELSAVSADFEAMGDRLTAADAAGQAAACGGATSPAIVAARLTVRSLSASAKSH